MFKCVLKSLSDTELVSIASEVSNSKIKTNLITSQLIAKSNSPLVIIGSNSVVRNILTSEVLAELSFRLLESDRLNGQK